MKHFTRIFAMVFAFILLAAIQVIAQSPDTTTPESLFAGLEPLYGALVIIGGYLSHLIPGINKIHSNVFRVAAFALLSGIAFITWGASAVGIVLTYAVSTSIYEIILKWIVPNKPKEPIS